MSGTVTIMDEEQLKLTLKRLSHELIENHYPFNDTCIIGIQPRGIAISDFITSYIMQINPAVKLNYGKLDITFYRDDFRNQLHAPGITELPFQIEHKNVILIDDVLFTGRTIRSAMDAIVDFGRPQKVELLTLIDRRYSRQLPIQADYVGLVIDSIVSQKVKVFWNEKDKKDEVILINEK